MEKREEMTDTWVAPQLVKLGRIHDVAGGGSGGLQNGNDKGNNRS